MLQDRVSDGAGVESIPLSEMEAKRLATLAKEGNIDAKVLKQMGVSAEDLIQFEHIAKHAFKSGISAAIISLVISIVPEVYRAIVFLISEGEINEEELRQIGSSAVRSSSEGFIRGVIAAALTTTCKSGVLGEALLSVSPAVIGMATVIGVDTIKNSFDVAAGRMSRMELTGELIKELIVSSNAFAAGSLAQAIIGVPVLGFMLGSFVGSIAGAFVYYSGFSVAISYCIDTGFTMFGLVEQDYMLPEDVLEAIGISVFEYEHFSATSYQPQKFLPSRFFKSNYEAESIGIHVLRRGVIGVSKIGYV